MKKRMRCCIAIILAGLMSVAVSCSGAYRSDVEARTLSDAVIAAIGMEEDEYYTADSDTYTVYFGESMAYSAVEDCVIVYHSNGTNVDQVGVFRVRAGEDVSAVRDMVQDYLDGQLSYLRSFAANYNPEEMAKIDRARVQVLGQYVVFTVLSAKDEDAALASIRKGIAQE